MATDSCPNLRTTELPYEEWRYDIEDWTYLPVPDTATHDTGLFEVLGARSTRREFGPLSEADLGYLTWFAGKTLAAHPASASRWEHRHVPSAGGRHPIDLLISNWPTPNRSLFWYDSRSHALGRLRADEHECQLLDAETERILGRRSGTTIWCGAQFGRTMSRYENGESLVWRDAGVIVCAIALIAEALGLACCPLGITGEPMLSRAIRSGESVVGVGGVVLGSRVER